MTASEGIDMFQAECASWDKRKAKDLAEIVKWTCLHIKLQEKSEKKVHNPM